MTANFAKEQLRSIVQRIERLEDEKAALAGDIREVYSEAKSNGLNTKIIRKVVALRRMDPRERAEMDELVDLYLHSAGDA